MTVDTIYKEIKNRMALLDIEYDKAYKEMIMCRVTGDSAGQDKAIAKRAKIQSELSKLRGMVVGYERN